MDLRTLLKDLQPILLTIIASSGFWTWLHNRRGKNSALKSMVKGLAHDRIIHLGMTYLERGYITQDEHENLYDYLYLPYVAMGGNGSAQKVIADVNKLRIRKTHYHYKGDRK